MRLYPWVPEEISIGIFLLKKNCILEQFIFLPYFHSERDKDLLLYSFIRERNFRNYEKSTILARRFHHSFESSESVDSPASLITSLAIVALSPTLLQEISKAQSSPCILLNLQLVKTAHTSSPRPRKKFLTSTPTPPASSSPKIQQRGSNKSTKERWSVPWFTAAENLWSRSFRRVPPVWEFVRGRSKRRKRARGRKKEGKKKKRKWSKKAERERRDMEGYRGWKDSTWPTFINIAIVRAPRAVFFIPYLLSRVPASVYARSYILEARFATGWLLSSEREREVEGEDETGGPVWPLKRSHDTGEHLVSMHAFGVAWNESTETPGNRNETALVWVAYLTHEPVASLDFSSRFLPIVGHVEHLFGSIVG